MKTIVSIFYYLLVVTAIQAQSACLVSQYNFSGNANDSKGSNHGTVYGASLTQDRFGNSNSAYLFSASNSNYISIPASSFLLSNYSYSMWVKPTTNPSSGSAVILLSIGGANDQNMQIENNQNNGAIGYLTGFTLTAYNIKSSTVSTGGVASGTLPSTNTWYHVVCTRDSNYFKVYVNGCLASTSSSQNYALPYYGTSNYLATIGCRRNGTKFFNGAIDEVAIYSCALDANEISRIYHNYEPFSITSDTTICQKEFKSFKLKSTSGYCSYSWINVKNRNSVLSTDSQLLVTSNTTSTYRVFNNTGDSATVVVKILANPKVNLGSDTSYCGNFTRVLNAGLSMKSYFWSDSTTNRTRLIANPGWYWVSITDSFGCKASDSIFIIKNPLPTPYIGNDTLICGVFSKTLDAGPSGNKYFWGFTDTLRQLNVTKQGKYKVTVTNKFGCSQKDSIFIKNPILHLGKYSSDSTHCLNTNVFSFSDTSKIDNDSKKTLQWSFGDETYSNDSQCIKTYKDTGLFNLKLTVTSVESCVDSLRFSIRVFPNSIPQFSVNKISQCLKGNSFTFANNSTLANGTIISYAWSFGDDSVSALKNISNKIYIKDSTYQVQLITKTNLSCFDTTQSFVIVNPNSSVDFNTSWNSSCLNNNRINIANLSSIRTGTIATFLWDFGDGSTSNNKDIFNKKYTVADSFQISLLSISDKGCRDSLYKTIRIDPNALIKFSINKDTQCFEWNRFDFANYSTIGKGRLTYQWDFGDGTTSTDSNISQKNYSIFGNYIVTLYTTSDKNCKDTLIKNITVHASPKSSFVVSVDRQCFRNNSFDFLNTSTINNGIINTHFWNLGEGKNANQKDVKLVSYNTEDSFYVELINGSDKGCYDTSSHLVVTFAQPIAKYTIPNDSQCWQKNYFNILNSSTLKYGRMTHNWDFGDGTSDTNYLPSTKKYKNASASYIVMYNVISDHGCTDSLNHRITLLERPIANFIVNDSVQCFNSHLFKFVNSTTFSALNTLSYYWDYGNGDSSIGINPKSSIYNTAKYHPVQLIAYSYLTNCYDTFIQQVLPAPHPQSQFVSNKDSQCLRFNEFVFNNLSKISLGAMTYQWAFRDGSSSNLKDPMKKYGSGLNYLVKLVAISNYNCKDSIEKPVVLIPHPLADFQINDSVQCLNKHSFDFVNQTNLMYGTYNSQWIFDDLQTSNSQDIISKKYIQDAYHEVKLCINSNFNCTDTISKFIFLEKSNNTSILLSDNDSQCLRGNEFNLEIVLNNPKVTLLQNKWNMGDGVIKNGVKIKYNYLDFGNFKIALESTSANSCLDTSYSSVVVHPHPVTAFSAIPPCFPDSIYFNNESTISKGSISKYYWTFGASKSSTLVNPVQKYSSPGYYPVTFVTQSNYNCFDTLINPQGAYIRKKPTAFFTFLRLPDKQFDVSTIKFTNQSSSDVNSYNWDFGDGNSSSEKDPEQDFIDTFRRKITLVVTNDEFCTDTFSDQTEALITDFVFYLPNTFTPDGNEHNDVYKPVATPYVRYYKMEIFNRWGEKVFESNDILKGWDGYYNGVLCPQEVYLVRVYLIPMRGSYRHEELTLTLLR